MDILLILSVALAIDLALGELPRVIHPVVWMGKITSFLARGGNRRRPLVQLGYGAGIALVTTGLFTAPAYFILLYLKSSSLVAYVILGALLLKSTFSLRELRQVALRVNRLLLTEKLDEARFELRSLVSRNTQGLSKPLIVSATIESVAENTGDSFVAPLFYFLLLGVPGAIAYRVVNTMDAMIGYHGKYEYLGRVAARLDDILNFIPARISGLLLVIAAHLCRKDGRNAWRIMLRDHRKTESPNAGWPMSAMAGALRTQLEKAECYGLGNANNPLSPQLITSGVKLAGMSALLCVVIYVVMGVMYFVFIA